MENREVFFKYREIGTQCPKVRKSGKTPDKSSLREGRKRGREGERGREREREKKGIGKEGQNEREKEA